MKILLIQPNYRNVYAYAGSSALTPIFPPFGLAYIAAVLQENGYETRILEANALGLSYEQIKNAIEEEAKNGLEYVGITASTCLIEEAGKIASLCPDSVKVIVGGIHATAMPEETLKEFPDIDIVVRGEGEFAILDLVKGKKLNKINGLSYRSKNKIIHNKPRELIDNLNDLPFPARGLLPRERYFSAGARKHPSDYILTSRGCPYSCIFCADHLVHGKKFRARSPENVVAEIEMLVKDGVKEIDIIDDNFTLLVERAERICDLLIEHGLNKKIIWRCSNGVRIDRLNLSLLKKMEEAGCYMLSLGIESGNDRILDNIKKGITKEKVREAVKMCKEVGMETRGLFMFGNLGENEETMQDTINFAKELDLDSATFHITIPFPMTEYWHAIKKEGKIISTQWKDYISYGKVTFTHGTLYPELLFAMQKRAYKEFYLRPKFIFKKLATMRDFGSLKRNIKAFFALRKFSN